jgi:hypothetical protein
VPERAAARFPFRRPKRERAGAVDLVDTHDQHTTDVLTELVYVGIGWHTTADAILANTAAAMARERRQHARDAAHTA